MSDLKAPVEVDADETPKKAQPPHQLKDRVRVCGRWQKKGYRPSKAEQAAWEEKCKNQDLDPKTGRAKVAKK